MRDKGGRRYRHNDKPPHCFPFSEVMRTTRVRSATRARGRTMLCPTTAMETGDRGACEAWFKALY